MKSYWLRSVVFSLKSLMRHKLRSSLTMLGVVFGVGSVVAMLSIGEGASREAMDQIRKLGSNNILVRSMKPQESKNSQSGESRSRTLAYGLLYEDLDRIRTYPAVKRIAPVKIKRDAARLGDRSVDVRLVGTTKAWFELVPREVLAGRCFDQSDTRELSDVCVIAEGAARELLAGDETLGKVVRIGGNAYMVIGIIRTQFGGGDVQLPDRPNDVYIPLPVMKARVGNTTTQRSAGSRIRETVELHQIICEVGDTEHDGRTVSALDNVSPTSDAIYAGLGRFHKRKDYNVSVPLALLRQARETQRIFNVVLGSIAGISLLVGGIGIMNIMLASVTERTREIGVRRAIGAKQRQILHQFLIETTTLSLMGGLVGVGVGVLIPALIEHFADMPTVVTVWSIALSLGISASVGILFGMYPAYRASRLDPIEALRHT